jgi:serine/threonine protein kinase
MRQEAIKEWFILKMASTLEAGPKVEAYFGFDLLMFSDCVEFAMETCDHVRSTLNSNLLRKNLAVLHSFRIAHRDIKPENIMLSPTFRKPVFIDFGLSTMVPEALGEKSLTNFAGSINFCSKEMANAFWSKS